MVYTLEHIVDKGETESALSFEIFSGGKGFNQAMAVARAGGDVYFAGCIGEDGEPLMNELTCAGANVSLVKRTRNKTGHAIIQVSLAGENSIIVCPGANGEVDKKYVDTVLAHFSLGDILLIQNEISSVEYLIERAHSIGMRIILNPSPCNGAMRTLDLRYITYLLLNEVEAAQISGGQTVQECIEYFKERYPHLKVVLTLGSKGCIYFDRVTEHRIPAYKVQAVDTTAAGDTFTGYFVAGIATRADLISALRLATAAAAIAVTKKGAAPSIPKREEAELSLEGFRLGEVEDEDVRMLAAVEGYLRREYAVATVGGLAACLSLSESSTEETLRRLTGQTFASLLDDRRCAVAAELLLDTDIPIEQISETVGYETEDIFKKAFRERYGRVPVIFRKIARCPK